MQTFWGVFPSPPVPKGLKIGHFKNFLLKFREYAFEFKERREIFRVDIELCQHGS
jgi:hypothetical protein